MSKEVANTDIKRIRMLIVDIYKDTNCNGISRLGGMTNRTYKVRLSDNRDILVRLPGEGTEDLIDRRLEREYTKLASSLGIDTELFYFNDEGEKVMSFVSDCLPMDERVLQQEENIIKIATILKKIHSSDIVDKKVFDIFKEADNYETIIKNNNIALYEDYYSIKQFIMDTKQKMDKKHRPTLVPCHNDPLVDNWLLSEKGRLYLIDWEYSGLNEAMWDVSCLSIEANYNKKQDQCLLKQYFGKDWKSKEEYFLATKLYIDYLWTLWGLARKPYGDSEFMQEYANGRYKRLKRNIKLYKSMQKTANNQKYSKKIENEKQ